MPQQDFSCSTWSPFCFPNRGSPKPIPKETRSDTPRGGVSNRFSLWYENFGDSGLDLTVLTLSAKTIYCLIIYLYFHSTQPHAARNDKDKVPDILQQRKGYIHFCHRFPVRCLRDDLYRGCASAPARLPSNHPVGVSVRIPAGFYNHRAMHSMAHYENPGTGFRHIAPGWA